MSKVITVLSVPNTPGRIPSIFKASLSAEQLVILAPLYLASARLSLQHGGRGQTAGSAVVVCHCGNIRRGPWQAEGAAAPPPPVPQICPDFRSVLLAEMQS